MPHIIGEFRSVQKFDAIIFDYRIREHVARDPIHLLGRLFARSAGSVLDVEEFSLPHSGDGGMSQAVERAPNGLALRVEHGGLEGNVDASLHYPTLLDLTDLPLLATSRRLSESACAFFAFRF